MNISVFRLSLVKEKSLPYKNVPQMFSPSDVADLVRKHLKGADREYFVVLFLDSRSSVIGIHTVSIGDLSSSIVHPREVFKGAILANAVSIICAHNHPSGEGRPSEADIAVTRKLVEAGKILSIQVEDHVVIGDENYASFRQEGLM